ncbi:acetyl-CoA carboxylase biotin carboxyl carrier protein [Flavobacteriales bacterium]|nr:acetyl-CoA carboxylase biotin carboxyl carrier protein [Flavobacteriales bacterium]MEC8336401.1 acetyl-CoA carboxylase biotin carboxyl carrier protein [Bacteroidota bacterium]MEC8663170.1 acetyl-CoA carboxylase biotin carboxyl carrier protein [Bacteroidota bacterium]
MKLTEIQDLIKFVARAGVTEVEIEQKDFKLTIKSEMPKGRGKKEEQVVQTIQVPAAMPQAMVQAAPVAAAAPAPAPAAAPAPAPAPAPTPAEDTSNLIEVKSPMIGTFYRRPSPDKDVFAEVGDVIKPGDTVCVIEAMKLFNEIEAEVQGKIVKVLVDDNSPVEYDQPLFLIDPS